MATYTPGDGDGIFISDISKSTQTNDVKITLDGEEVAINDGGNAITVDGTVAVSGTVTVDLGANNDVTMAVLPDTAAGDLADINTAVSGTLIVDATGQGDVPITLDGEAVAINDGGNVISVDDAGSSLTVDNAALSVVGGGTEATALRVTVASNSTGVLSVDDNGGSLTVDNSVLSVTGGGTETGAMRVTIANNSTGVLSVDDNGGSLTVDGTVTANLGSGSNNVGKFVVTDGSNDATIRNLASNDALNVAIVDGSGNQVTSFGSVSISGIGHGVKSVTTAGTDVVLASSTACKRVIIQAQTDNTGWIAVGGSGVDATIATGTGVLLGAGDSVELDIDDLNDVYIDSTVSGEGVRYTYFT